MSERRRDDTRDQAVRVLGALALLFGATDSITGYTDEQQQALTDACDAMVDVKVALERFIKLREEM